MGLLINSVRYASTCLVRRTPCGWLDMAFGSQAEHCGAAQGCASQAITIFLQGTAHDAAAAALLGGVGSLHGSSVMVTSHAGLQSCTACMFVQCQHHYTMLFEAGKLCSTGVRSKEVEEAFPCRLVRELGQG